MYPHRIRLRGPWQIEPLSRIDDGPLPPPCRATLPCRWMNSPLGPFAGRVRLCRRFGYPGRIDPHEHVWLTFAAADRDATVWLNGELLGRHRGAFEPFEFEVTTLLHPRNELLVELDSPVNGGLWGEVALEVRCPAFLSPPVLTASWENGPQVNVQTQFVGTGDDLELYILVNGRTVSYTPGLTAATEGVPFHIVADVPGVEPWQPRGHGTPHLYPIRIDLVKGGALWYAWEGELGFRDVKVLAPSRVQINGQSIELKPVSGNAGNYLGIWLAESPIVTDAAHLHCDREGILLRQALPQQVGDSDEDQRQTAALSARLLRHACIVEFGLST